LKETLKDFSDPRPPFPWEHSQTLHGIRTGPKKIIASREVLFHERGVIDVLDWCCSGIAGGGIALLSARQNEKKAAHGYRFLTHPSDHHKGMSFPVIEFHFMLELRPSSHKLGHEFFL
jgi:hypothetical protein